MEVGRVLEPEAALEQEVAVAPGVVLVSGPGAARELAIAAAPGVVEGVVRAEAPEPQRYAVEQPGMGEPPAQTRAPGSEGRSVTLLPGILEGESSDCGLAEDPLVDVPLAAKNHVPTWDEQIAQASWAMAEEPAPAGRASVGASPGPCLARRRSLARERGCALRCLAQRGRLLRRRTETQVPDPLAMAAGPLPRIRGTQEVAAPKAARLLPESGSPRPRLFVVEEGQIG